MDRFHERAQQLLRIPDALARWPSSLPQKFPSADRFTNTADALARAAPVTEVSRIELNASSIKRRHSAKILPFRPRNRSNSN